METEKMSGVVSWFNDKHGYGKVKGEDGQLYFIHYKQILGEGFKTLAEGQAVRFDWEKTPRGLLAKNLEAKKDAVRD